MQKRMWWIAAAVALLAIIVGLCVWKAAPGADADPTPSPEASASVPEEAAVTIYSGQTSGAATQQVAVGENVAAITVLFDCELQGDAWVITGISSATAEKLSGWHHVEVAAAIDRDKIIYAKDGAQAAVPVTYQASIGEGNESYDAAVVIDLSEI